MSHSNPNTDSDNPLILVPPSLVRTLKKSKVPEIHPSLVPHGIAALYYLTGDMRIALR